MVPRQYSIETKRSLLCAISFDDEGELQLGQNSALEPTRGGGTGFEQDLLLFERASRARVVCGVAEAGRFFCATGEAD